jgi:hypothetical protein
MSSSISPNDVAKIRIILETTKKKDRKKRIIQINFLFVTDTHVTFYFYSSLAILYFRSLRSIISVILIILNKKMEFLLFTVFL